MKFLRSVAAELIGLFVADWLQTAVIVAILAAGWYAIAGLRGSPLPVLVVMVLLLTAQLVWFALAEARRTKKAAKPSPSASPS
jgi:ABC-type xylose transport system permease subunit